MTVAIAAGTLPIPNNNTMGMRYTVAGTVCMASRTGRSTDSARLLTAVHTPNGTPTMTQIPTDTAISEMVSMLSCHTPTSHDEFPTPSDDGKHNNWWNKPWKPANERLSEFKAKINDPGNWIENECKQPVIVAVGSDPRLPGVDWL
jgi:hypothetical protein